MPRRHWIYAGLGAWLVCSAPASAQVELIHLTADKLAYEIPDAHKLGVAPGDILLRNQACSAVIFASHERTGDGRMGRCLLLGDSRSVDAVTYLPAPQGLWQAVDVGQNAELAVVRLRTQQPSWNAELMYKLQSATPWIEVATIVRNQSEKQTLAVPLADGLMAENADVRAGAKRSVFVTFQTQSSAALVTVDASTQLEADGAGRWMLAYDSGDPAPSMLNRFGKRVFFFTGNKQDATPDLGPFSLATKTPQAQRFRIEPGKERTVVRRLVGQSDPARIEQLAELAAQERVTPVQMLNAPTPPPVSTAARADNSPQSAAKRIVGRLRGGADDPAPAASPAAVSKRRSASAVESTTQPGATKTGPKSRAAAPKRQPALSDVPVILPE